MRRRWCRYTQTELAPFARLARWPLLVFAAAIGLAYFESLRLPLSFDDAWMMRLVRDYSPLDLFLRTANSGYYRPVMLAYYRVATLFGASGPLLLHVLCLMVHSLNSWRLTRVLGRVLPEAPASVAWMSGAIFALLPFAVQEVAVAAGLNHLIALLFMLLAVERYAIMRTEGASARQTAALLVLCLAAVLANEIALSVIGLLAVVELFFIWRQPQPVAMTARLRQAWPLLAAITVMALYAVAYALIPKGESPAFQLTAVGVAQRSLYALQTLTFPVSLALTPLLSGTANVIAASAMLFVAAILLMRRDRSQVVLFGLLLFGAGAALPVLRLESDYVHHAPRVFYVAGAGVAFMWAGVLAQLPKAGMRAAAMLVLCAIGIWHVRDQIRVQANASEPVAVATRNAAQMQPDQTLLMLNMPEWVAVPRNRFPLFSEGAIVMASYVGGSDLPFSNLGIDRDVRLARFTTPDAGLPYAYQTFGELVPVDALPELMSDSARVLLTRYDATALRTEWIGGAQSPAQRAPYFTVEGALGLSAYHVQPCRTGWVLALQWRRLDANAPDAPATWSAFAQVLDLNGTRMAQQDGAPLRGLLPFARLPRGADMMERRWLMIEPGIGISDQQPGPRVLIGLYDYQSGARLPLRLADGSRPDGDAFALDLPALDPAAACE